MAQFNTLNLPQVHQAAQRANMNKFAMERGQVQAERQDKQYDEEQQLNNTRQLYGSTAVLLDLFDKAPDQVPYAVEELGQVGIEAGWLDPNAFEQIKQDGVTREEIEQLNNSAKIALAQRPGFGQQATQSVGKTWINPETGTMWGMSRDGRSFDTGVPAQQYGLRPVDTAEGSVPFNPATGQTGPVIRGTDPSSMRDVKVEDIKAETEAKTETELRTKSDFADEESFVSDVLAKQQNIDQMQGTIDDIDRAIGLTSWWSTGTQAQIMEGIGATDARELRAALEPVKASLAFDRLQQMRDASKTGGALGQVSERELALLMGSLESLDQAQGAPAMIAALKRVRSHYENVLKYQRAQQSIRQGAPFITTPEEAKALPPGTVFVNPNGDILRVPGG